MISRDSPLPSLAYLKISGGIYHDCAVHDIDLMTWILGEYPEEVYSCANSQMPEIKEIDDFDNLVCTLKFPSGMKNNHAIGHSFIEVNSPRSKKTKMMTWFVIVVK